MQPIRLLITWLKNNTGDNSLIFTLNDFRSLFPALSNVAFKTLMSRAVSSKYLIKVCRDIYMHKLSIVDGLVLFHIAALLRADHFNYISLETALSDAGVISQIPINHITIMSSGRSNVINCGIFGTIEFVHTNKKPEQTMHDLIYDDQCKMWRASIQLALRDMKLTRRSLDLVDEAKK